MDPSAPITLFPASPLPARSGCLAGLRIGFVGRLGSMNRRQARSLLSDHGATVVPRLEPGVDLVVIGADHLESDDADSDWQEDWLLAARESGELEIIEETALWQRIGLVGDDQEQSQLYTPAMLAKLLNVPLASIRRWHRRGLIVPVRQVHRLPYFDFAEVASARRIAKLIASGASPAAIENKLTRLARLAPELERPLSQLSVIVDGRHVLFRQGEGLVEASGQKRFDFEASEGQQAESSQVFEMPAAPERNLEELSSPEEFLQLAVELEDADQLQSATEVYRAMGLAFGVSADVCFRLAELLYQIGDLTAARERYFSAVELDPTFVEARASLGCVLVELGERELAISAFRGALDHHPDYPDVHFHLAGLLEESDQPDEARQHLERFLELAPRSPWADEARERLDLLDQG